MPLQSETTQPQWAPPRTSTGILVTNPSKTLLDLLQDAYDAGADPDLGFDDYLHHAVVGGRLHLGIA